MQSKIVVTSNTDIQKLTKEFKQLEYVTALELFLEVEVGKEEEMFTTINNHLQQFCVLKELSFTFKKYSVFNHFQIITKGLSYLKHLEKLSFLIKENSFFTDSNLIELTDGILGVLHLTDLTIIIASGSSIKDTSLSYITQCIQQLSNLSKLNLQLQNTSSYKNEGLKKLGDSIKNCIKLKELILFTDFQLPDMENISTFFHSISTLTSLEKFEMRMNLTYGVPFIVDELMKSICNLIKLRHLKLDPIFLLDKVYTLPFEQIYLIRNCIEQLRSLEVLKLKGGIDICTSFGMKSSSTLSQLKEFESSIRMNGNSKQSNVDDQEVSQFQQFSQFKNLEKLKLTLNSSDQQGKYLLQSLAMGFESMDNLTDLKIKQFGFNIRESERIFFFRQLKYLSNLRKFKLEADKSFDIDQYSIDLLGVSLMNLKSLNVLKIKIKNQLSQLDLSNFMISILSLTGLEELSIDYDKRMFTLSDDFNCANEESQMKFFKELSALVALKELNLLLRIPITKVFSDILRDSLLHLICLEKVQLYFDQCTFSDISRVMEGLKSERLKFLEIDLFQLKYENEGSQVSLFDCSQTITELSLKINRIDHEAEEFLNCLYKPLFQNLKKLKCLEKLKIQLSDCTEIGVSDLRNFLYSSPQLLKISVTINHIKIEDEKEGQINTSQQNEWVTLRWRKVQMNGASIFHLNFFERLYLMQNIKQIKVEGQIWIQQGKKFTNIINNNNRSLPQYLGHISILLLDSNYEQEDVDFYKLLKHFSNLKSLQLSINDSSPELSSEKIFEVGSSLSQLVSLQTLDLEIQLFEDNNEKSWRQLSAGLKKLQNLQNLTLKPKMKKKKGNQCKDRLAFIMDALSSLVNLESLTINANEYSCENLSWLKNFGQSLSNLENIQSLNLQLYNYSVLKTESIESGIESIGSSLKYLSYLCNLDIQFIGNFKIDNNRAASTFGNGVLTLSRLTRVILNFGKNCEMSQEGAVQIIEGLSNLSYLEHVELVILGYNSFKSDLMSQITKNLSQLRSLKVLKIDLFGDGHVTTPPFAIEQLISSHTELPYSQLFLCIDQNIFSSQLECIQHSYTINLKYSSDLKQYKGSDITLPTSILKYLKDNCKLQIQVENTNNLKSRSLNNLLEQISELQVKDVKLYLCMNSKKKECLEIIDAVSQIQGIKCFSLTQYTNQFSYREYRTVFDFLEMRLSQNLQNLTIIGDDELYKNTGEITRLTQKLCSFKDLRYFQINVGFLESYPSQQYIYRILSRKLLNLTQLNIQENYFLSKGNEYYDESEEDENDQEGVEQTDHDKENVENDSEDDESDLEDDESDIEDVESDLEDDENNLEDDESELEDDEIEEEQAKQSELEDDEIEEEQAKQSELSEEEDDDYKEDNEENNSFENVSEVDSDEKMSEEDQQSEKDEIEFN